MKTDPVSSGKQAHFLLSFQRKADLQSKLFDCPFLFPLCRHQSPALSSSASTHSSIRASRLIFLTDRKPMMCLFARRLLCKSRRLLAQSKTGHLQTLRQNGHRNCLSAFSLKPEELQLSENLLKSKQLSNILHLRVNLRLHYIKNAGY